MAAADPVAAARRPSMAPSMAASAVPTGAAPVVPAFVPQAQTYEDDEDEVEDIMRPKPAAMQQVGTSGPSLGLIFGVALVVITLSAVVTFYALEKDRTATTAASLPPSPIPPLLPATAGGNESSPAALEPAAGVGEEEAWSSELEDDGAASSDP